MDIYYEDAKEALEKVWSDKSLTLDKILENLQGLKSEVENYIEMIENDMKMQEEK